jgi:hypothetical protein
MEPNSSATSADAMPRRLRWYQPTPGRLLLILLAVEALLLLSERLRWFAFNESRGQTMLIAIAAVAATIAILLVWLLLALCFRWRFQFSLRSLLVFTVAVAIPCSWLAVEMSWVRQRRATMFSLKLVGSAFQYEYELDRNNPVPPGPAWLRQFLGDDFFAEIIFADLSYARITDADLDSLRDMTHIRELCLNHTPITDAGLKKLTGRPRMYFLWLAETQVTDKGVKEFQQAMPYCHVFR